MVNTRTRTIALDRFLTLNRALDQALSGVDGAFAGNWVPPIDLAERTDAYVLSAELPGVEPATVDVGFEQNVLTIKGSRPAPVGGSDQGEVKPLSRERRYGAFERSIRFPDSVDADRITATFRHGVLTIEVPKARAALARKIEVQVG